MALYAQTDTLSTSRKHDVAEAAERKVPGALVPEMIIIVNYSHIVTMEQYQQIKASGDIIKQYTIASHELVGEVRRIMIVETRRKDKYQKLLSGR